MKLVYFDTNILLNFYHESYKVSKFIIEELEKQKDIMLIVPYRVCFEFAKDRNVIIKRIRSKDPIKKTKREIESSFVKMSEVIESIGYEQKTIKNNLVFKETIEKLTDITNTSKLTLNKELDNLSKSFTFEYDKDDCVQKFVTSHKSNYNPNYQEELSLAEAYSSRCCFGLPPGLTDNKKEAYPDDPFRKAGDYFIWYEMLYKHPKSETITDVIFVTDESKGDFWDSKGSNTINHFLEKEFSKVNPTIHLSFYHFYDFLKNILRYSKSIYDLVEKYEIITYHIKDLVKKNAEHIFSNNISKYVDECNNYRGMSIQDLYDCELLDYNVLLENIKVGDDNSISSASFKVILSGSCSLETYGGHIDDTQYIEHYLGVKVEICRSYFYIFRFDDKLNVVENDTFARLSYIRFDESYCDSDNYIIDN